MTTKANADVIDTGTGAGQIPVLDGSGKLPGSTTPTGVVVDSVGGNTGAVTAAQIKTTYESNASTNAFTDTEQTKLTGIEASATADQTKGELETLLLKGSINGLATLDAGGVIPQAQLGPIAISETFVVANQTEMLALVAQTGDVAVRTDENKSYILKGTDPSVLGDWQELLNPGGAVTSVDGNIGAITAAQIKTTYESNANTNAFTDTEQTKLTGIEASATADQTGAEIKTAYELEANTNAFTDTEQTKLTGIATGANVGIVDVVSDTTPQLGGNLDVQSSAINTSVVNGSISVSPNGTGNVILGTMTLDSDQVLGVGVDNFVLTYDNGTGLISLEAGAGGSNAQSGAHVYQTSGQTINTGLQTILNWDGEIFDTATIHDNVTNNSRLTVPVGVTAIKIFVHVRFSGSTTNVGNYRDIFLRKNGTASGFPGQVQHRIAAINSTGDAAITFTTNEFAVVATDYFEVLVTQDSGANVFITANAQGSQFGMEIIR